MIEPPRSCDSAVPAREVDAGALGPLGELLGDAEAQVRGAAVECFRALGPPGGAFAPRLAVRPGGPASASASLGRCGALGAVLRVSYCRSGGTTHVALRKYRTTYY